VAKTANFSLLHGTHMKSLNDPVQQQSASILALCLTMVCSSKVTTGIKRTGKLKTRLFYLLSVIKESWILLTYTIFKKASTVSFRGVSGTIYYSIAIFLSVYLCNLILVNIRHTILTTLLYYLLHPIKILESSFHQTWSGIITTSTLLLNLLKSLVYSADMYVSSNNCITTKKILYISIVRSCLLYFSPLWRPHLWKTSSYSNVYNEELQSLS